MRTLRAEEIALLTCLLAGLAVLLFALPHGISGDGAVRYVALAKMVEHRTIGNIKCSYLVSIFAVPLYLVGRLTGNPVGWCAQFNSLVTIAMLVAMYRLLRGRLDRRVILRFFLILIAASMWANHLRDFYGELLTAAAVMVGGLLLGTGHRLWGWLLLIVGTVNAPACGVGLGLTCLRVTWKTRRMRHLMPVLMAGALILLEKYAQTGSFFVTGYEGDHSFRTMMPHSGAVGFSYPFLFGLVSICFSFGKGLLFFAPGLVLLRSVFDERTDSGVRESCGLWLIYLCGMVAVYSKWWAWYGGWCWGPRFFLLASAPASLALAVSLSRGEVSLCRAALTLVVLLLSAWVGIDGAVFGTRDLDHLLMAANFKLEMMAWYTPEYSVLCWPFVHEITLAKSDWVVIAYCGIAAALASAGWWKDFAALLARQTRVAWETFRAGPAAVDAVRAHE